ncbi:MAG: hypothetical protein AAB152_02615 [Candidatus Coatesbacteria bacterium]
MGRGGWWIWVAAGVAWGLLCVGVRHTALMAGMEMQQLVAERSVEVAKVQSIERRAAEARRLESIERLAAAQGFLKAPAGRVVVVAPERSDGVFSRWFGGDRAAAEEAAAADATRVNVRPREEVMTAKKVVGKPPPASRRRATGKKKK